MALLSGDLAAYWSTVALLVPILLVAVYPELRALDAASIPSGNRSRAAIQGAAFGLVLLGLVTILLDALSALAFRNGAFVGPSTVNILLFGEFVGIMATGPVAGYLGELTALAGNEKSAKKAAHALAMKLLAETVPGKVMPPELVVILEKLFLDLVAQRGDAEAQRTLVATFAAAVGAHSANPPNVEAPDLPSPGKSGRAAVKRPSQPLPRSIARRYRPPSARVPPRSR